MIESVNVVVIGGGAAGLAAAVAVEAQGLSCQILEARSRLGGRVHTTALDGVGIFDRGAQMVNGDMTAVLELARQAGLDCSPVPRTGASLCVVQGEVIPREDLISADEIYDLLDAQVLQWDSPRELVRALRQTYLWWTTPWDDLGEARRGVSHALTARQAPKDSLAAALDALLLCEEDHAIAYAMFCEICGAAPEALDAPAFRAVLKRYASKRDDLEFQFPQGLGQVIDVLSHRLDHTPRLEAPVTRISATGRGVTVTSAKGRWQADHAIVAVPPSAARRIAFDLDEADALAPLLDAFEPGDMIKTVLIYETAFWRLQGLSGTVSFSDPAGLVVVDTSMCDASPPRLTAFLGGPEARIWSALTAEARIARLLHHLTRALGPKAQDPLRTAEAIWVDDPWSGGGYNASVRVGRYRDAVDRLASWDGPVRFAGAELDGTFWGYVEGAIRSGRKAARDIYLTEITRNEETQ
jgi:monoamine oxidase